MPRQNAAAEFNSFVAGLITDASPLTFPDNASLDEDNFVLNRDGSRNRRLGMDLETSYEAITTNIDGNSEFTLGQSSFTWDNAGGDPDKTILVIQIGNEIHFFDLDFTPLSSGKIDDYTFSSAPLDNIFSYAVVDGLLVVASGLKQVTVFDYDVDSSTLADSVHTLYVRDLFGVEDIYNGTDLTITSGVEIRPTSLSDEHLYNLRNQSWALPRLQRFNTDYDDCITHYRRSDSSHYPSNADAVTQAFYPHPDHPSDPLVRRFISEDVYRNPIGSTAAAQGYFIIDALERGASRIIEEGKLRNRYPQLDYTVSNLPTDSTPGGPSVVTGFAGRVWFAGFSGEVEDGDSKSPRLSSYVMFSQVVNDPSQIGLCYQDGDPTSYDTPDVIATDGGFIRIDGAYGIKRLVDVGSSLLVVATNGVWRVTGGSDYGFSATEYKVDKITDHGVRGRSSVLLVDNTIMFWGDDGIYHVHPNEYGDWVADNISQNRIQTLYDSISTESKRLASGHYDGYSRKARWIFNNDISSSEDTRELILDLNINAFYTNTIGSIDTNSPKVINIFETKPFSNTTTTENIVVNNDQVQANSVDVVMTIETQASSTREIGYVALTDTTPNIEFTFSNYSDIQFKDWRSVDDTGVDAAAYLVTGYLAGGDFQRKKQVNYLTAYFKRTEDGFSDIDGELIPNNQSSCLLQAQWKWHNTASGNEWRTPYQIYRYKRYYAASGTGDTFDTGEKVITTKNKIRGRGRVISLKFYTEEGKDCHLYGWSMILGVNSNV